jgi:hypothetical protein
MRGNGLLCRRFFWFAATLICAVPSHAQGTATPSVEVPLVYSTVPMIRNADLMLSASILSTAASEAGLAKLSPSLFRSSRGSARAARAIKLALFDFPVVFYFVGLNHEWGHQARGTEYGVDSHLSITGGPWSAQQFRLVAWGALPEDSPAKAAVHGGGLEASRTLKDRSEVRMLRGERVLPGHALAAIVSSLDSPVYALHNLSPHRFADGQLEGDVPRHGSVQTPQRGWTRDPS